eukprot:11065104-Prorocentrum_lima.AAC.1
MTVVPELKPAALVHCGTMKCSMEVIELQPVAQVRCGIMACSLRWLSSVRCRRSVGGVVGTGVDVQST